MFDVYLSNDQLEIPWVLDVLKERGAIGNIYPIRSVVRDRETDAVRVERGARVTLFETDWRGLLEIWAAWRDQLGVHCIWVDETGAGDEYHGCILQSPAYLDLCERRRVEPDVCSEY